MENGEREMGKQKIKLVLVNKREREKAEKLIRKKIHPVRYLSCEMRSIIFHRTKVYLTG